MKVSVITVVFNNVNTIAETIQSVLEQDYDNIEYIIIDGESDDGTLNVIEEYRNNLASFISQPDEGIYDAMNKGLALASGDIVGFLNADDLLDSPDCISEIVDTFKDTKADIVYGDNLYVDRDDPAKVVRSWKPGEYDKSNFRKGWVPPHMSTYIRTSLFECYGRFQSDFEIAADYELLLRFMYVNNAKSVYLPKVISRMREGGISNNSYRVIIQSSKEVYKSWKLNDLKVSPFLLIRKPFSKLFQYF